MRVHASVIRGPTLYRHGCRKCAEETLHNARVCTRCETSPWLEPIKIAGNARRMLTTGMKAKSW
jgi:hypothetical protein